MRNAFLIYISLELLTLLCSPTALAQGAAPETAPSLFPGGGLVSYNSVFTTRQAIGTLGSIPATVRPTFSHEASFNLPWGFYHDFDVTLLVPIVTNRFEGAGGFLANPG